MYLLELFSGTATVSRAFRDRGHRAFTVDTNGSLAPDLAVDIRDLELSDVPFRPDVIWASPPCTGFSVASIGRNWTLHREPKTETARLGIELVQHTFELIRIFEPTWWFIENPRGMLRTLDIMRPHRRVTVTYCQYGDTRMKPTDIWTNTHWVPRPPCKSRAACHEPAPRGSRTGTQGLAGAIARSEVPYALPEEIAKYLEVIELPRVA